MKKQLFDQKIMILFSLTILCIFISCKKESPQPEPAPPAVLHFLPEALEYVQLKQGMYLIYKDSASGQTDSILVKKSLLENKFSEEVSEAGWFYFIGQTSFYYDVCTLMLTQADDTAKIWFFGIADCRATMKTTAYVNIVVSSDSLAIDMRDKLAGDQEFEFPVYNPRSFYIAEMIIDGTKYNDVLTHFSATTNDETDPLRKSETLYWAKGVGIIKWQKTNGSNIQTFTLLRHS